MKKGDADYKPYVNATPEVLKIPLGGQEDFLILGSDGLWDHVSQIEVAKTVYNAVHCDPGESLNYFVMIYNTLRIIRKVCKIIKLFIVNFLSLKITNYFMLLF